MAEKTYTACVVIIGNEILSGRTRDENLAYIAQGLADAGVVLKEARIIPDVCEAISSTINELRAKYDHVFTTGGIGPTHDDITAECVAKAFGVKNVLNPEAHAIFQSLYKPDELNEARLRMCHIPEGATLIVNAVSRAPGFKMENVYVMAGIPRVMQAMFDVVKPTLKGGKPLLSCAVSCDLPEGLIAKALGQVQARYPGLDIGSYPSFRRGGGFHVSLVLRGRDAQSLDQAVQDVMAAVRNLGGNPGLE
jgi:molybdenum cofactor synthesis domain-containing protein